MAPFIKNFLEEDTAAIALIPAPTPAILEDPVEKIVKQIF